MKLGLSRYQRFEAQIVHRGRIVTLPAVTVAQLSVMTGMGIVASYKAVEVVELSDELATAASDRVTRVRQDVERLALRAQDRTSLIGKVLEMHRAVGL